MEKFFYFLFGNCNVQIVVLSSDTQFETQFLGETQQFINLCQSLQTGTYKTTPEEEPSFIGLLCHNGLEVLTEVNRKV